MALVTLIEASPWAVGTGAAQDVRLAGGGARAYDHLGHSDWRGGVVNLPRFRAGVGFDANGWTGATQAQTGDIRFFPSDAAILTSLASLYWIGCPVTVKTGDDAPASPSWSTDFTGTVANVAIEDGALRLSVSDNGTKLDVPVTIARFAGSGLIEGDSSVAGRLKRRSWGRCWNVEARVLLAAYNIYELSDPGYRLQAIDTVKDIGRAATAVVVLDWQGSIGATLAALIAADAPDGGAVVAPSIACVKWWTQPILLTADIRGEIGAGYVETAAAIAERLAGLGSVAVGNASAMAAARPAPAGLHIGNEAETIAVAIDRLLLGASMLWHLGNDGVIVIREWSFDGVPAASLQSVKVSRSASYAPMKSRRVGYRRNERIHSAGEISSVILAADVEYADGTPVQDLWPAEPGATAGAPAGTYVADKLAEEVVADAAETIAILEAAVAGLADQRDQLSKMLVSYLQNMLLEETRERRAQAISYLDGDALHTVQRRETQERIDGDAAIISDLSLIGARSGDGTAWVLSLDTVRVTPTETFAERLSEIDASIDTVEGEVAANYTALQTAIAYETSARATAISMLGAEVDTLATDTAASIASVQDAIADEAAARSTAITAVQAAVDAVEADLAAEVTTLEEALADETSARASAISSVNATVSALTGTVNANYSTLDSAIAAEGSARASALSTVNTTLGSHTASIASLSTSLSTLTSTEASHYSTLTATIGGIGATVASHSSALATAEGRTEAFWDVVVNGGSGAAAFVQLKAGAWGGSVSSDVAIGAREIHLSNSVGNVWVRTMDISAGVIRVWGKLQTTDAVITPNIVANNVTQMESTLSGSAVTSNGDWKNIFPGAWHTFTLSYAAEVLFLFMGRANYSGSSPLVVRMLLYNASESLIGAAEGPSSGDGTFMANPGFPWKMSLSPGTYHISPQFVADAGDVEMRSGSGVIVFWRYK